MAEINNETSTRSWLRLGVEVGKLTAEIAAGAVRAVFGEAEYIDPPIYLRPKTAEPLRGYEDRRDSRRRAIADARYKRFGHDPDHVNRAARFKRSLDKALVEHPEDLSIPKD